jgi:hypothetical protein
MIADKDALKAESAEVIPAPSSDTFDQTICSPRA